MTLRAMNISCVCMCYVSMKKCMFGYFIGTLYLVTYLVCGLETSKGDYVGKLSYYSWS